MKYIAQCPAGLQEVAANQLAALGVIGLQLRLEEEGFLAFDAKCRPKDVSGLPYLNNVFGVVDDFNGKSLELSQAIEQVLRKHAWIASAKRLVTPNERTFRLFLSDNGQLVGGDGGAVAALINTLAEASGLQFSSRHADGEFWLIRRRNGRCFFAKRLSCRARTEKTLEKGELRPEFAHLLCLLSEPEEGDIFLDPFAGSGAIPFVRAQYPYEMIFIGDSNAEKIQRIKATIKVGKKIRPRKGRPIITRVGDALALERFKDGFIHKVVTDPPWGMFDMEITDLPRFYMRLIRELIRVTRSGGVIVLLVGDKEIANMLVHETTAKLVLAARYEVLVNGRKASVLKWRRLAL